MKKIGIVGRTNVGKSTLFNRLIKQDKSIVSDLSGTTRDLVSGEIMIDNSIVQLIDFGGFDFGVFDEVDKNVQKKIKENIAGLDLILFIVDGRCLISKEDRAIAEIIRKSKKPAILVVNKVDGPKQEDVVYDFYSLGFSDLVAVSASNSKNIDELTKTIAARMKIKKAKVRLVAKKDLTKITIIGKQNVGKSSLFNALYGEEKNIVTDIAGTTRDSIDAEIILDGKKYIFVDTAGLRRKVKISKGIDKESSYRSIHSINSSDLILYVLDVGNYATSYDIKLLSYAWRKGKPIIIVVNKWDIKPRDMTENKYKNILLADNSLFKNFPFVFVSAVKKTGFDKLAAEIKRIEGKIKLDIKTSALNKELRSILLESAKMNQKFYYATQTNNAPVEILIFVNKKKFFDAKTLLFLEKQIRDRFDLLGIPVFIKMREKEPRT